MSWNGDISYVWSFDNIEVYDDTRSAWLARASAPWLGGLCLHGVIRDLPHGPLLRLEHEDRDGDRDHDERGADQEPELVPTRQRLCHR